MKKELDEQLVKEFPKIFADRYGNMMETAMCWGFECHDGWYKLIKDLCTKLQRLSDLEGHQIVASQVKEKFGTLRFYVNSTSDIGWDLITTAENRSSHTCEVCGDEYESKVREKYGWLGCRCIQCAIKEEYPITAAEAKIHALKEGEYTLEESMDKF